MDTNNGYYQYNKVTFLARAALDPDAIQIASASAIRIANLDSNPDPASGLSRLSAVSQLNLPKCANPDPGSGSQSGSQSGSPIRIG
jgi:hypothetical protein